MKDDGAAEAIEFYIEAFGAKERMRMGGPDGRIGHAEFTLGDAVIMLADEHADIGFVSPGVSAGPPSP
jgi:PhnB protein